MLSWLENLYLYLIISLTFRTYKIKTLRILELKYFFVITRFLKKIINFIQNNKS